MVQIMGKTITFSLFQNKGVKQTILKNTFWLTLSEVFSKGLFAVLAIFIARYLGAEGFGKFSFVFGFVILFSIVADFGLVTMTIREVARDVVLARKYISNILAIKLILGVITIAIIIIAFSFLNKTSEIRTLIIWAGIWVVVQSFVQFFQSIFRAFEKMEYEAFSKIIYSVVLFGIVFFAMYSRFGIGALIKSYIIASLISFFITLFLIKKKFVEFKIEVDLSFWRSLLSRAWPFAFFMIFSVIYFQISTVMLSVMVGDIATGLYSVAFNSVAVFLLLAEIVANSILPALSKSFGKDGVFKRLLKKLFWALLDIGLFLAVILFFTAPFFIKLIYGGQFAGAIAAFQVMVWILPIRFMNYLFGVSLIAANLQKKRLNAVIVCALFNVLANLILIPIFSFMGAAVATLATEAVLFSLYFVYYKKIRNA